MADLIREVREARRLPSPALARAIRQGAGVSQQRIARELGVHRITVVRWEQGTTAPRGEVRSRYARLLADLQQAVTAA